jgi:lipopolysaccharide transport system permease protein
VVAETLIRPAGEQPSFPLREYYGYRHLFAALVRRNIRLQFADMRFGFAWACMRPLLYVLVFVAFRRLSNANTRVATPYPVYLYSGLILWYYLLESLMATTTALQRDAALITKVYYPRLITLAVPVVANLWGLALASLPLLAMMAWYGITPGWPLLLLPVVILQMMAFVAGVGTVFASLTLYSRDWERFLSYVLYLGLFVSPVIYAPEMIPARARPVYFLNPLAGSLLAFRSALFALDPFPWRQWLYSAAASMVALAVGLRVFRAAEGQLADRL